MKQHRFNKSWFRLLYKKDNSFVSLCFCKNNYIMKSSYQVMKFKIVALWISRNENFWLNIFYAIHLRFQIFLYYNKPCTVHCSVAWHVSRELLTVVRAYICMTVAKEFSHYFNQSQKSLCVLTSLLFCDWLKKALSSNK